MPVRANFIDIFIYRECVTKVCEAERNWREYMRVSMGLTVRRKTAKNLAIRRKNERILAVSRKKN